MNRDFPFLTKILNCNIKELKVYNTYKKIYELIHFMLNFTVISILSYFEKNRKNRYPLLIQEELYNIVLNFINHSNKMIYDSIDVSIINQILILLNIPRKKNNSFYSTHINIVNNNLTFLSNDLNILDCTNIDLTDLKKL
jgi:hypothetical protein